MSSTPSTPGTPGPSHPPYGAPHPGPPPQPGAGPRPDAPERRWRPVAHVLPAVSVLVVVGAFVAVATLVFSAVFVLDDAADLNARDALGTLAFLAGLVLGVTLFCVVVGLALDRLTLRAPWFVRVPAALVVPVVGAVLAGVGVGAGFYLVELGVVLCGYWAVLLVQQPLLRAARWALARVRGTTTTGPQGPAGSGPYGVPPRR